MRWKKNIRCSSAAPGAIRHGQKGRSRRSLSLDKINAAYRLILEHEEAQAREAYNEQAYGKYKGMAHSAQKLDHFFSYYKFHLLGAIVLIAAVIYGINAYVDHKHQQEELAKLPPSALALSYSANFRHQTTPPRWEVPDLASVEDKIVSRFPDWKRVIVHLTYVPAETQTSQDIALVQKSILDLISNKDDVYILDRPSFEKLADDGGLISLDDDRDKLGTGFNDSLAIKAASKDDSSVEHIYGVDVSNSPLIRSLGLEGQTAIAAIRIETGQMDHSLEFIRAALSDTSAP